MYSIERIEELIKNSEGTLAKYELLLKTNPNNLFYKGIVKNTLELLVELRHNLAFEKQKREKEIIDIRLKGKVAKEIATKESINYWQEVKQEIEKL